MRERLGGKVTYAAIPIERIDWRFDFTTIGLIRSAEVADRSRDGVCALVTGDEPVVISEFGTATWRGARGGRHRSMEIIEHDADSGAPVRLDGDY